MRPAEGRVAVAGAQGGLDWEWRPEKVVGLELLDLCSALPRVLVLFLRLLLRLLREYEELRSSWDFCREDLRGEVGRRERL